MELTGSLFMQSVAGVKILLMVPRSLMEIAQELLSRAARAVGMACRRNPLPFFIPCHRVVGSKGKLVGYRGGLD